MNSVEERVQFYVAALQQAAIQSGYGVISVETLNKTMNAYVAKHRPPLTPEVNLDKPKHNIPPPPTQRTQPSSEKGSNVVDLFRKK